jgi:hypothetical protein
MILAKVDQASMWYGVEARAPFLNKSFAFKMLKYSEDTFFKNYIGKRIIKEYFLKKYGINFFKIKKHGFGTPVYDLFKNKNVIAYTENQLNIYRNYCQDSSHVKVLESFLAGKSEYLTRDIWHSFVWVVFVNNNL